VTAITIALCDGERDRPDPIVLRSALHRWAFNTSRRCGDCPDDIPDSASVGRTSLTIGRLPRRAGRTPSSADGYQYPAFKWKAPKASGQVDRRVVVNPVQARVLLNAVGTARRSGPRLVAFFGLIYFSALRPEEAANVGKRNLALPESGLMKCISREGLPKITYLRVWRKARALAFTPEAAATPLGATPYTLRHACVSTWLNGGVPPTQVAEWAGHSVEVLLKVYAKCLDGQDTLARRRVLDALGYRAS
jgi:integrase